LNLHQIKILNNSPSWISTLAVVLAFSLGSFSEFSWWVPPLVLFWLILSTTLPQKPRRVFLVFSLLAALRLLAVETPEVEKIPALGSKGSGSVQSVIRTAKGFRLQIELENGHRVLLRTKTGDQLPLPGDQGEWRVKWDTLGNLTVPGSFDQRRWLISQDCMASGVLLSWLPDHSHFHTERLAFKIREWLRVVCQRYMFRETGGVMVALLVGDKSGLDEDISQDFRATGLVHILTVSGFHIVFLSSFLQMMLAALRIPPKYARMLTVVMLMIFVPITGSSASVQRAVFMFGVVQIAAWMERPSLSLHALGVACTSILLFDPASLEDIGFQLSCGATAGILLGQTSNPCKRAKILPFLNNWILSPTWICFCATLGTFPILVYHFQSFSPISFVGNLLVIPLMGFAMEAGVLLLLSCACGPLATGFGQAASILVGASVQVTHIFSTLPGTNYAMGPWPLWLCILILAGGLAWLPQARPQKLTWCAAIAWCAWGFTMIHPPLQIWFLDAAQGDATMLRFPSGKTLLLDAGNGQFSGKYGSRTLVPFCRKMGIGQIDALIISHPDLDHYGGATSLIESFPVKSLWIGEAIRLCDKPGWVRFLDEVSRRGIPIRTLREGMAVEGIGAWKIHWIHSPDQIQGEDWNGVSAVMRLDGPHGPAALFMADLGVAEEAALLKRNIPLRVPVIKLGHHGSQNSSSREFLARCSATHAVISCGLENRYGHPSPSILKRLDSLHSQVWNTEYDGSILFEWDSEGRISSGSFRK
jgi:competence protein ComEC